MTLSRTSLLLSKKEELRQQEERVIARERAANEREKTVFSRESALAARESACANKEEENRETQRKLNLAAEALRGHWDKLRGEKDREQELVGLGLPGAEEASRRSSTAPVRPPFEERNTVPLAAVSRFPRLAHPAYEDTPSKIPLASVVASPALLDRLSNFQAPGGPALRRNTTKSLGNLASAARADVEREAARAEAGDATPTKQTIPYPRHQRTSIGSPSELKAGWSEDVSMSSPAITDFSHGRQVASLPTPRRRRDSIESNYKVWKPDPAGRLMPCTSPESIDAFSRLRSNCSDASRGRLTTKPPTMIPAPAFVYREAATPARWTPEDPDLPSPFIRRYPTAPLVPLRTAERQPLAAIDIQTTIATTQPISTGKGNVKPVAMPRSRSGNLHQQLLRTNAEQAMGARLSTESARDRAAVVSKEAARILGGA